MPQMPSQCYVKRETRSVFTPEHMPRLVYVTRTLPEDQSRPRILHAHQDVAEILLI